MVVNIAGSFTTGKERIDFFFFFLSLFFYATAHTKGRSVQDLMLSDDCYYQYSLCIDYIGGCYVATLFNCFPYKRKSHLLLSGQKQEHS